MNRVQTWLACLLLIATAPAFAQDANDDEPDNRSDGEVVVMALGDVPPVVMATAKSVGPDVFFNGATSYWEDDFRVYRVSGRLFREVWNVYVREDGKLLRAESDTQDN